MSSTTSTHALSCSVRTARTAPVVASASITRSVFWSRGMRWRTSSFGPAHSMLGENGADGAGRGVGQPHAVRVLEPGNALEDELVWSRPLHARQVVLARIVGNLEPGRGPA